MLRFFRFIRRPPLNQGQMKKYSLYAIGEILLVVIGILIALQINNWNEQRKDRIKEKQYLQNLYKDLDGQSEVIATQIQFEDQFKKETANALTIIHKNEIFQKLDTLYQLTYALSRRKTFTKFTPTYEDLKATGNLQIILNEKLKGEIITYYHHLENTTRIVERNNANLDDSYKRSMNENKFGFFKNAKGKLYNKKLRDPENVFTLIHLLQMKQFSANKHLELMQELEKITNDLKQLIQKEINP